MSNDPTLKRWTAKRTAAVVLEIFKAKTTAAEAARQYDLTVSEFEGGIEEAQRSMESGFRARPKASARSMSQSLGKPRRSWARPTSRTTH
ncbi:DUF1153 domain-containing protein [Billgrantia aerodenitrificans]|uniref:DUF1153 domain-containing protein n=1 Tax=Billgrantia aerodenitrificans TaxID=2733483 RepID=UPI001F1F1DFF|nr:DUF1153 domain-containing protein [Halomonas aerodenitrificans]